MSCLMQGIFLLQKNVSVLANYVQTVLCYSNIIKGNVIPKTNNETEDFTMKRKMVSALLCATMVAGMVVVPAATAQRSALWFYPPVPQKQRGDHRHPLRAMAHPLCDKTSGFLAHYHKSDSGRIPLLSFPVSAPSLICCSWHLHLMFIS